MNGLRGSNLRKYKSDHSKTSLHIIKNRLCINNLKIISIDKGEDHQDWNNLLVLCSDIYMFIYLSISVHLVLTCILSALIVCEIHLNNNEKSRSQG